MHIVFVLARHVQPYSPDRENKLPANSLLVPDCCGCSWSAPGTRPPSAAQRSTGNGAAFSPSPEPPRGARWSADGMPCWTSRNKQSQFLVIESHPVQRTVLNVGRSRQKHSSLSGTQYSSTYSRIAVAVSAILFLLTLTTDWIRNVQTSVSFSFKIKPCRYDSSKYFRRSPQRKLFFRNGS